MCQLQQRFIVWEHNGHNIPNKLLNIVCKLVEGKKKKNRKTTLKGACHYYAWFPYIGYIHVPIHTFWNETQITQLRRELHYKEWKEWQYQSLLSRCLTKKNSRCHNILPVSANLWGQIHSVLPWPGNYLCSWRFTNRNKFASACRRTCTTSIQL